MWYYNALVHIPTLVYALCIQYESTLIDQRTRVMRPVGIRVKKKKRKKRYSRSTLLFYNNITMLYAHGYKRPRPLLFKYFRVRPGQPRVKSVFILSCFLCPVCTPPHIYAHLLSIQACGAHIRSILLTYMYNISTYK